MEDEHAIGLPPPKDAPAPAPSSGSLWMARGINLFGLVSPAANLGLVFVGPKDRRWFGLGAGVVCTLVLLHATSQHRPVLAWIAGSVHFGLVLVGLVHPLAVAKIGNVWAGFGARLGHVMAYPMFTVVYYLAITPTALILRLFGKDPLRSKAPPSETYWTPREPPGKERYERQF